MIAIYTSTFSTFSEGLVLDLFTWILHVVIVTVLQRYFTWFTNEISRVDWVSSSFILKLMYFQHSVVGLMTMLRAWRSGVRIPAFQNYADWLWNPLCLLFSFVLGFFLIPLLPIYAFIACTGKMLPFYLYPYISSVKHAAHRTIRCGPLTFWYFWSVISCIYYYFDCIICYTGEILQNLNKKSRLPPYGFILWRICAWRKMRECNVCVTA